MTEINNISQDQIPVTGSAPNPTSNSSSEPVAKAPRTSEPGKIAGSAPAKNSKGKLIVIAVALLIIFALPAYYFWYSSNPDEDTTPKRGLEETLGDKNKQNNGDNTQINSKPGENEISLFFVDLENKRGLKDEFGCSDSVISTTYSLIKKGKDTPELIKSTLEILLDLKDANVGKGGMYNVLYQSDLKVESVELTAGKATVNLTGELVLGGVCDNPRVEEQLKRTVMQFDDVNQVEFFIDGVSLQEKLSGR